MNEVTYSFSTLRYVHDPSAGEALNVGVVLYAPDLRYLAVRHENRYSRLSEAFAGFDGSIYRKVLLRFDYDIQNLCSKPDDLFQAEDRRSLQDLLREVWPDQHLSFQFGPVMTGITADPAAELISLFDRMVGSRYHWETHRRRSDEDVWQTAYRGPLTQRHITNALQPRVFKTQFFEKEFDYAFRNGAWQVLQPMSMEYEEADTLQEKASHWLGYMSALERGSGLDKIHFLLGAPKGEHRHAYVKAKNLLNSVPIQHEIVEESEAESYAGHLAEYLERHGILETP